MATASIPVLPKDGKIEINDATSGTPKSYEVIYEDGDFQVTGLTKSQKTVQVFKDRGTTYAVREVEDVEIEFSFSCHAISLLGDGTTATLGDVILKLGTWASAVSTLPAANGDAYCLTVKWTGERSNHGATGDTTVTLKYCHLSEDFAEGIPGKLSIKGTAYIVSNDYLTITG